MLIPTPPLSELALEWVESLLEGRQRELADLNLEYSCRQISADEYLSCRCSLLQAVREIAGCLRQVPKRAFVTTDNINETS